MLVKVFSVLVAGSFIVAAGALGYMASDRSIPIEILGDELKTPQVRPGGQLERQVRVVQRKRCYIHSDRAIFDASSRRHLLPPLEFQGGQIGPLGTELNYVVTIPIPLDIAIGPARFEASTVYRCNLLQWVWPVYSPYNPIEFEVVPL